ncbi:heterokaryon incompatibility 6, or allele [Trichoderma arundinaceum]|uniref:Heterokaryon incompatibility 6, or allele n=1 Tax=Trichoderma arundinaceum TaxID=490622 RepID=A0A395NII1_TRIAR|nr:heterokaryon incompatibility 6, or allele [Trichoderma arundinaceum]
MADGRLELLRDFGSRFDLIMGPDRESLMKAKLAEIRSRNAKKEIEDTDEQISSNTAPDFASGNAQSSEKSSNIAADATEEEVDVSDASDEEISAFFRLVSRPWFTRCWILQEVCLAREAVLLCGTKSIDWDVFYAGFAITIFMSEKGLRGRPEQLIRNALILIGTLRPKLNDADTPYQGVGLLWLLRKVLPLSATDPRDKIYAILGLLGVQESEDLGLIPDYTLSVSECYQKATLAIMSQSKSLDILTTDRIPNSTLNLPSWVIDWSILPHPSPMSLDPNSEDTSGEVPGKRPVCASLSTHWTPVPNVDTKTLMVSGYDFDQLIEVEDILTVPPVDHTDIAGMSTSVSNFTGVIKTIFVGLGSYFDTLVKWEKLAMSNKYSPYPSGEDKETVFAITMCTGSIESPEIALQRFQKWRKTLRGPQKISFLKSLGINGGIYKSMVAAVGIASGISVVDDRVYATATETTLYRRLARTKKGYLAIVPSQSVVGDQVALYKGGKMPFIVRPAQEDGKRELVGPCYVHGIMYGEGWNETLCQDIGII